MKMDYAAVYGALHRKEKWFVGYSLKQYVDDVAELVRSHAPRRLLDYGCGKGYQYLQNNTRYHERWGGLLPYVYDPGIRQFRTRPEGVFDGIICTDVMEHIDEADVDEVLADIFSFASRDHRVFVLFGIACEKAYRKELPDGRNVHLTTRPPEWWNDKLAAFRRDGLTIAARFDLRKYHE